MCLVLFIAGSNSVVNFVNKGGDDGENGSMGTRTVRPL